MASGSGAAYQPPKMCSTLFDLVNTSLQGMTLLSILPHYSKLQYFSGVYLNLRQFINIQHSGI